jgi:hypothetical protein
MNALPQLCSRAVNDDQVRFYRENGFLIIHGVFRPDEIAAAAAEADRLTRRADLIDSDNLRCRWQNHFETDACLFECFDPVIDIAPILARLAHDSRILDTLECIFGEPACLFKDKIILKPPGARGYELHQDYIAWPTFPRSFTTVIVTIDSAGKDNGATEVFPGCHRAGCLSAEDGEYHALSPAAVEGTPGLLLELEPGDIAVFGAFMPHRSSPNGSTGWRRLLYLSYNARSDGGDFREQHYREFHAWLTRKYSEYGKLNVFFR